VLQRCLRPRPTSGQTSPRRSMTRSCKVCVCVCVCVCMCVSISVLQRCLQPRPTSGQTSPLRSMARPCLHQRTRFVSVFLLRVCVCGCVCRVLCCNAVISRGPRLARHHRSGRWPVHVAIREHKGVCACSVSPPFFAFRPFSPSSSSQEMLRRIPWAVIEMCAWLLRDYQQAALETSGSQLFDVTVSQQRAHAKLATDAVQSLNVDVSGAFRSDCVSLSPCSHHLRSSHSLTPTLTLTFTHSLTLPPLSHRKSGAPLCTR
jgi:hypothetical protein